MGYERFGEFSILTMEKVTQALLDELKRNKKNYNPAYNFAEYEGIKIACILRNYTVTSPVKRILKWRTFQLSPTKDVKIDIKKIKRAAMNRYS
jgi:hypothetical protein